MPRPLLRGSRVWILLILASGCDGELITSRPGRVRSGAAASVTCIDLTEGETLLNVSSEGEAWLGSEGGLRLVTTLGESTQVATQFGAPNTLTAWTSSVAFAVGDNLLWNTSSDGSTPIVLPSDLGNPQSVCGDPSGNSGAFVLGTRGLFERRDDSWWRWDIPVDLQETLQIRDVQGACSAEQPSLYFTAEDSLWAVHYGDNPLFLEMVDLDGATEVVADSLLGIVALRGGTIVNHSNRAWNELAFDEGRIDHISAADGVLWATIDTQVYRRDVFGTWEAVDALIPMLEIDSITGYAAGSAWLIDQEQLCHVNHPSAVRIEGVRPYQRVRADQMQSTLGVFADPSLDAQLTASIDGSALQVAGGGGEWTLQGLPRLVEGWHAIQLELVASKGGVNRTIHFAVEGDVIIVPDPTVFWSRDIEPIFNRYCMGCHGDGGTQRFLGSYEDFKAAAAAALAFVRGGQMPPPPSAGLDVVEIELLETWIEEGMAE